MSERPAIGYAELLRQLRAEAGLTQEGLAAAAGVSPRTVSDLERGISLTPRKATAELLADALHLTGHERERFMAATRRRSAATPGAVSTDVGGPVDAAVEDIAWERVRADRLKAGDPANVGGYRLLGRLGSGGMGQVFLGVSQGGRRVVVKLIRPEYVGDAGFRRRFAREVEAAQRVGSVHTAPVVDADPDAHPPWMVIPYIPGPSLAEAVTRDGPLSPLAVRELGAALADGLAAIHDSGIIHRDLKPGNIILADDGPRIIDFGIASGVNASLLTTGNAVTTTQATTGTPAYMSPEQVQGHIVGPASDIFSLGSVLAFAATGDPPFGGGEMFAVGFRIVHGVPDLARVPASLLEVISRCLYRDPAGRPTANELLAYFSEADPAARRLRVTSEEMTPAFADDALQRPGGNRPAEMAADLPVADASAAVVAGRDGRLSALRTRLAEAASTRDIGTLLDGDVLAEIQRLADTRYAPDDIQARYVLGWLYWYQYLALPEGQDGSALESCVDLLTPCFVAGQGELPDPLLPLLAERAVPAAVVLLDQALSSTDSATLSEAITLWGRIVNDAPADAAHAAMWLSNLGVALRARFERTGEVADLESAIEAGRAAVDALPPDHPDRAAATSDLGGTLLARYLSTGSAADLDSAIDAAKAAVSSAPPGNPNRAKYLSNLGVALQARFERTGEVADLESAIEAGRAAVDALPPDHPDRAAAALNLEEALRAEQERAGT